MLSCFVDLGWVVTSCGSDTPLVAYCAAPRSEAVEIAVRDSISGQAAANGAIGTLQGAGVDDTLQQVDSLTIRGGNRTARSR